MHTQAEINIQIKHKTWTYNSALLETSHKPPVMRTPANIIQKWFHCIFKTVKKSLINLIGECEKAQDYVTREILETLLDDTEMDHIYWIEQHLNLIKLIGLPNYIQSQMGDSQQ